MMIMRKALSRRTVLRGLGTTIALPLLDAMVPALTAVQKTAAGPVRRLGVVYHPNGVIYENWLPKGTGRDFALSPVLEPLAPFKSQLIVITNLASQNEKSAAVSLIGRTVTYTDEDAVEHTGTVEKVATGKDGKATLTIAGTAGVDPTSITQVA